MAYRGSFSFGFGGLTPWVQRLIIANIGVFIAQAASGAGADDVSRVRAVRTSCTGHGP